MKQFNNSISILLWQKFPSEQHSCCHTHLAIQCMHQIRLEGNDSKPLNFESTLIIVSTPHIMRVFRGSVFRVQEDGEYAIQYGESNP